MNSRRRRFLAYFMLEDIAVLLVVYAAYRMLYNYPKLEVLAPLALEGHGKLLVLAPHCDDETLSSAGVILAAQRLGMQVSVVIESPG